MKLGNIPASNVISGTNRMEYPLLVVCGACSSVVTLEIVIPFGNGSKKNFDSALSLVIGFEETAFRVTKKMAHTID